MTHNLSIAAVELINVIKIFDTFRTSQKISALQGCDLEIKNGELISIIGPSGAGKTTLLNIIAGIEEVSSGEVNVGGFSITKWSDHLRKEFRRKYIGIFTQSGRNNFDPRMTVKDAIKWETMLSGWKSVAAEERTTNLLSQLGLINLRDRLCGKLSAGEAMRISLIKALAKQPFIILADEPTGQLDSENMGLLYNLMRDIVDDHNTSIIVATHDIRFQRLSDRSLLILNGKLASEEESSILLDNKLGNVNPEEKIEWNSKLILDSNNTIRIPTEILENLGISKKIILNFQKGKDFAIIKKSNDDPYRKISEKPLLTITQFNRSNIKGYQIVEIKNLVKNFREFSFINQVLSDINISIFRGELVIILGPSGSGKTTLLNLIAGLDKPTSGDVIIENVDINTASFIQRRELKLNKLSYLTQNYIVHPYLSVEENAYLPLILRGEDYRTKTENLEILMKELDIFELRNRIPTLLSGGQQQRSSFLASILKDTPILLADEPTANLDSELAIIVMNELVKLAERGKTIIVATHDFTLIQPGFRVIRIDNKSITSDVIADSKYCKMLHTSYLSK